MGVSYGSHYSSPETQGQSCRRVNFGQATRKREQRLFSLRENLYRQRLSLKEKRTEIREKRDNLDELQAKLIASVSRSLNLGTALEEPLLRDLQTQITAKTDELGALQYDYDQAEEDYDIAEGELNDQEGVESEIPESTSFDVGTQSSQSDCVAGAEESARFQLRSLEHLQGIQTRRSLSSTQIDQSRESHKSSIRETGRDSSNTLVQGQPVAAESESIKEDSDHDILEATFFMRIMTTDREHNSSVGPVADSTVADPVSNEGEFFLRQEGRQWESASHQGFTWDAETEPSQSMYLESRQQARSDSGITIHRKGLIRRQSRIIWWLFNTFGSSGVDYLERSRNKVQLDTFEISDDAWARQIYNYWTRNRIPLATSDIPGDARTVDKGDHCHVEAHSLGGSYLLLPSGTSTIQHSVEKIERQFPSVSTAPEVLDPSRPPTINDDLSSAPNEVSKL